MPFMAASEEIENVVQDYAVTLMQTCQKEDMRPNLAAAALLKAYINVSTSIGVPYDELLAATATVIESNREGLEELFEATKSLHGAKIDGDDDVQIISGEDAVKAFVDKLCGKSKT